MRVFMCVRIICPSESLLIFIFHFSHSFFPFQWPCRLASTDSFNTHTEWKKKKSKKVCCAFVEWWEGWIIHTENFGGIFSSFVWKIWKKWIPIVILWINSFQFVEFRTKILNQFLEWMSICLIFPNLNHTSQSIKYYHSNILCVHPCNNIVGTAVFLRIFSCVCMLWGS